MCVSELLFGSMALSRMLSFHVLSIQIAREENECQRKIHQQSGITSAINYKNKFRIDAHIIDLIWKPNKDFNLNIQPKGQCITYISSNPI